MGLLDIFRSNETEDNEAIEDEEIGIGFDTITKVDELRRVITNKRATIGIKGEEERIIEYDFFDNGEFKRADEWGYTTRGWTCKEVTEDGEHQLRVSVDECERVLEVNPDYLKYIDPAWEHEETLVTEVEITYKEYDDGTIRDAEVEVLDSWVEAGDTTES